MQSLWSWSTRSGLVACVLTSAVAVALLAARVGVRENLSFVFLVWNLFLAWVPLGAGLLAAALARTRLPWLALPTLLLWLAFLPNAPYLITDLLHMDRRPPIPAWFDATMLGAFAAAGLVLTGAATHAAVRAVRRIGGAVAAGATLLAVGPAVGFGIYLGRFLRWNSWDLVTRPGLVALDVADRFVDPLAHPRTWAVTAIGAALTWAAWGAFASVGARSKEPVAAREAASAT